MFVETTEVVRVDTATRKLQDDAEQHNDGNENGQRRRKRAKRPPVSWSTSLRIAATVVGAPGILHIPASILLQPTISSCLICIVQPVAWDDVLLGVVGLLACLAYCGLVIWRCTCGCLAIARTRTSQSTKRKWIRCISSPLLLSILFGMFDIKTTWRDLVNSVDPDARGFVRRNSVWLEPYRRGRHWFPILDCGINLISGIVGGMTLSVNNLVPCANLKYTQTMVNIVWLLLIVVIRPFREPIDQPIALSSALISVLWGLFTVHTVKRM